MAEADGKTDMQDGEGDKDEIILRTAPEILTVLRPKQQQVRVNYLLLLYCMLLQCFLMSSNEFAKHLDRSKFQILNFTANFQRKEFLIALNFPLIRLIDESSSSADKEVGGTRKVDLC